MRDKFAAVDCEPFAHGNHVGDISLPDIGKRGCSSALHDVVGRPEIGIDPESYRSRSLGDGDFCVCDGEGILCHIKIAKLVDMGCGLVEIPAEVRVDVSADNNGRIGRR